MNQGHEKPMELKCGSCGATVVIRHGEAASFCVFCGTRIQLVEPTMKDESDATGTKVDESSFGGSIEGGVSPEVKISIVVGIAVFLCIAVYNIYRVGPEPSKANVAANTAMNRSANIASQNANLVADQKPSGPSPSELTAEQNLDQARTALSKGETEKARAHLAAISSDAKESKQAAELRKKVEKREEREKLLSELRDLEGAENSNQWLLNQTEDFTSDFGRAAYAGAVRRKAELKRMRKELEAKLRRLQ